MAKQGQAGFSLVELVIVMAITGSLAVIAFAGQRGLRSRAQFDAGIDRMVASIDDIHNQSTAGVNVKGNGNGSTTCGGGPAAGKYIFAGTAWSAVDSPTGATFRVDYYAAYRGPTPPALTACIFETQTVSFAPVMRVNASLPVTGRIGRVLFVRNDSGGINVCQVTSTATDPIPSFRSGSCTAGAVGNTTQTMTITNPDGYSSQVQIDPSGLARRRG